MKLVIFGRDGVLNRYRDDHVKSPQEWEPIPGALRAVARLNHAGWHAVVATNQAGIGRGMIDMASMNAIHAQMQRLALAEGGRFDAVFFCPHAPQDGCGCRKPMPGLMLDIATRFGVDLRRVPMVGDTLRDLQAAQAAGCEPHLVRSGRAVGLDDAQCRQILGQVPQARFHDSLDAFAGHLLAREESPAAAAGGAR